VQGYVHGHMVEFNLYVLIYFLTTFQDRLLFCRDEGLASDSLSFLRYPHRMYFILTIYNKTSFKTYFVSLNWLRLTEADCDYTAGMLLFDCFHLNLKFIDKIKVKEYYHCPRGILFTCSPGRFLNSKAIHP
jgi:hypothetical protein